MVENTGNYKIKLKEIINEFNLEIIWAPDSYEDIEIGRTDLNRPGLQLGGFFDYFDNERLEIIGKVEMTYLQNLDSETRNRRFESLLAANVPPVIFTRGMDVFPDFIDIAKKYDTPLLRTEEQTSVFMAALIAFLNLNLAPRITRHGVLVEVYGEGVLLLGESGIGKSETAIELVKRGHRLIADDAVELKRVSAKTLLGSAPEIIRHFIELRGIGVVDVRRIFGMGAVKPTEKIDLIINLEIWRKDKHYDRLGIETEYTTILDVRIPSLTVPVKPGRNLAVIIEVAAMANRNKKMGYNAARELTERINAHFENNNY
ncbi:MAG: HPr(Ser) kinase/phosphatase [Clostridiales bacterium]|jgi:HPr kinase/phosphorylase|nr:HPr(Ser) kinase/phosphatase [Clostridiales bacterium]